MFGLIELIERFEDCAHGVLFACTRGALHIPDAVKEPRRPVCIAEA